MEPQTIDAITYWITLITLLVQYIGGIFLVVTAGIEALKNKAIRLDRIVTVGIVLILIPYGIRNYGLELADASIDLLNGLTDKRPEIEAAIERFLNENNPSDNGDTAVTVPTAEFTPTPLPTIENQVDFAATATAYFGDFPTALPANTPMPEYTATWSLQDFEAQATRAAAGNPTPVPTICVAHQAGDIARGCVPPTPVPGN